MILQALQAYYQRLADLDSNAISPEGWIDKGIDYVIEVYDDDRYLVNCLQRLEGAKRKPGPNQRLPNIGKQALKHTNSGKDANLLWDKSEFVLGLGGKGAIKLVSFVSEINHWFGDIEDEGITAVVRFLNRIGTSPDEKQLLLQLPEHGPVLETGAPIVTFSYFKDDGGLVCHRPAVRRQYELLCSKSKDGPRGTCLISGEHDASIQLSHPVIKNVWGGQTSGGAIISFNKRSFESYGKADLQGQNAPVSEAAAFAYTTALNQLLSTGSRQRIQVGDASTVFWAEQHSDLEDDFALLFGEPRKDDPEHGTDRVKALHESVRAGKYLSDTDGKARFYVLGLAPNAARIAVRFWHVDTVAGISGKIATHFNDLDIAHAVHEPDVLSLFRLLAACALQGKADNIPPNLGGDVMRAVLQGSAYPQTWLQAAVRRNRAEQSVSYPRAAVIKACLNRLIRSRPTGEKELTVSLDETNSNTAYRLGRLFSTLEKIQEEANPGLNATIRERYYGAASSSPVTVFTTLMRLKNHHLAKLENRGRAMNFERLIGEIMSGLNDFPAQLPIAEQGRFAIGYYHQRQAFYTKTVKNIESEGETK